MADTPKFWQLTAFSEQLDSHFTTVNQWFKSLEAKRIHYVSRAPDGTKVYTEQDLAIGRFIKEKRSDNWSLDGIFSQLEDEPEIELRAFPDDFKGQGTDLTTEVSGLLRKEFSTLFEQMEQRQIEFEERFLLLQQSNTNKLIEERQQRITDLITENRIKSQLELEALEEWEKLPLNERLIKTGLFKKTEDTLKRERFIKKYALDHFSQRLKDELE